MLRPIGRGDLETAHKYATDPDITKYMLFLPDNSEADTFNFLSFAESEWNKVTPCDYEFAICCNGTHIGGVNLAHIGDGVYEMGWIIDKPYKATAIARKRQKNWCVLPKV